MKIHLYERNHRMRRASTRVRAKCEGAYARFCYLNYEHACRAARRYAIMLASGHRVSEQF